MKNYIVILILACYTLFSTRTTAREAISNNDQTLTKNTSSEITASWDVYLKEGTIFLSMAQDSIFYEAKLEEQVVQRILGKGSGITFSPLVRLGHYKIYALDPRTNYTLTWLVGEVDLVEPTREDIQPSANSSWIKTKTYTYYNNNQPYQIDVAYYNGLGYLDQTVNVKANASGQLDLITPVSYDCHYHADAKTYLPYTNEGLKSGKKDSIAHHNQRQYYSQLHGDEDGTYAYYTKIYNSSSDFSSEQKNIGKIFHAEGGKSVKQYQETNTKDDQVYSINFSAKDEHYEINAPHLANTLLKHITISEDNIKKVTFSDQAGHVILERIEQKEAKDNIDTYYAYDEHGRLALVLPPQVSAMLSYRTVSTKYLTDEYTRVYCYYYLYDKRGNVIQKHIPGRYNDEFMVYDDYDRLIKYSNGNYGLKKGNYYDNDSFDTYWQLYKYDDFSRLIETKLARVVHNSKQILSADTVVMASYTYDKYIKILSNSFAPEDNITTTHDYNPFVKGLKVQDKFLILSPDMMSKPTYIQHDYFYDYKSRVIQIVKEQPSYAKKTRISFKYDYTGNILAKREAQERFWISNDYYSAQRLDTYYTYDQRGRLTSELTVLNQSDSTQTSYAYDDLGRQILRYQNGISDSRTYNIQGWLTAKSNPYFSMTLDYFNNSNPSYSGNITEWSWKHRDDADTNTYAFIYRINRLLSTTHYIGAQGGGYREDGISYDKEGNLQTIKRTSNNVLIDNLRCVYDPLKGGLQYVYKIGQTNAIEQQTEDIQSMITAEPMHNVRDSSSTRDTGRVSNWSSKVLSDINTNLFSGDIYKYDVNLNTVYDPVKQLNIRYNCLGLVNKVLKDSANFVNYRYLADGTKLSVEDQDGNGFVYQGSFVYRKTNNISALDHVIFKGGKFHITQGQYELLAEPLYYYTDHLGSVRVVTNQTGAILERNDYYPSGERWNVTDAPAAANTYRFNGKELQVTGDLNWLDYGARMYDSYIMRWLTPDPLAEKYYSWSPYAYCAGNPIKYIDLDGRKWVDANGNSMWANGQWSKYATPEVQTLGNTLRTTPTGMIQFNKLVDNPADILVTINQTDRPNRYGHMDPKEGATVNRKTSIATINSGAEIVIYQLNAEDRAKASNGMLTNTEAMTVNFGHEIEHTTNENITLNVNNAPKAAIEKKPKEISTRLTREFEQNKPIITNDIIKASYLWSPIRKYKQ